MGIGANSSHAPVLFEALSARAYLRALLRATLEVAGPDVAFLVALGYAARALEGAAAQEAALVAHLRIARHPLAISQAHLRAVLRVALNLLARPAGTHLHARVALALHGAALPAGTVLLAVPRGALHVLAAAPGAHLLALLALAAAALEVVPAVHALLAQRFAAPAVPVVALRVQVHADRVAVLVEDAPASPALGVAALRGAVEHAVAAVAVLPALVDVSRALEVAAAARTCLHALLGAARERAVGAAVLAAELRVTRERLAALRPARLLAVLQLARRIAVTAVLGTRLHATVLGQYRARRHDLRRRSPGVASSVRTIRPARLPLARHAAIASGADLLAVLHVWAARHVASTMATVLVALA